MRVLNPYLFIGLGGSGGKTLQYLRYYLDQRLKRSGWEKGIPDAWQFLWFDVPPEPEQLIADGGIPSLPIENYYSFTNSQISRLDQIDEAVRSKEYGEKLIMGWAPTPGAGAPPIQKGAGQFRGVGRLITLSQYDDIQKHLLNAYNKISGDGAEENLKSLTAHITGTKLKDLQGVEVPKPIPIIISSLAGGCGAGSFLDVADILKTVDPGAQWLNDSYSFLYTPDVFHKIDAEGLHPNALAAISELLSGTYSNFEDSTSFQYLAKQLAYQPIATSRGPKYPVLIGRSNGQIDFDNQENVYKTTSRALMGMTLSTAVQQQLTNFVEANMKDGQTGSKDITGLYDVSGEIYSPKVLSMGYASVSLGRDYFQDYSVERFTSMILDTISEKHITDEVRNNVKTEQQAIEELASRSFDEFLFSCGLNERGEGKENDQIIEALLNSAERKTLTMKLVNQIVEAANNNVDAKPVDGTEWELRYKNSTPRKLVPFQDEVRAEIIKNAVQWSRKIEQTIIENVSIFIGREGAAVVEKMLDKLEEELSKVSIELDEEMKQKKRGYDSWEGVVTKVLSGQSGRFDAQDGVFEELKKELAKRLICFPHYETREVAIDLVNDIKRNIIVPLKSTVRDLVGECSSDGRRRYGADSWATDTNNPKRFEGADNEFFIDDPAEFPRKFEELLIQNARALTKLTNEDVSIGSAKSICVKNYLSEFTKFNEIDNEFGGNLINPTTKWSPINTDYRKDISEPQHTGVYQSPSNPLNLIERTRDWFEQRENSFKNYLNKSLVDYLKAEGLTTTEKTKRSNQVSSKISEALDTSKPLITISEDASNNVHSTEHINEDKHFYTQIPIKSDEFKETQQSILNIYNQKMKKEYDSSTNKEDTFFDDTSDSINSIEYFTMFSKPVQPFIFESLFREIVKSWEQKSGSEVDVTSFWKDRRTRSLDEFLPLPIEIIFGLVRGYFVAKLIGVYTDETDDKLGIKASIDGADFPFPLIEVVRERKNVLGILLETLPLAYSKFSMNVDKNALEPYLKLLDYGKGKNNSLALDDKDKYAFKSKQKEEILKKGIESCIKEIEETQEGYLKLFKKIEYNQAIELQRKHTQTYDLRHFILPAFESILHALANIDQDSDDGIF